MHVLIYTMRLLFLYAAGFILFSASAYGQADAAKWQHTITSNTLAGEQQQKGFRHATPGFALYYSQVGNINEPYLVYVPRSYDPSRPAPVVVFLHGAILARDSFQYKEPTIANEPIFSVADALNTIVIFPFGRSDLRWSGQSPVYENIVKMIGQTGERYNVDKKKVYIGGISMGGIATFWFIDHHPELFAGFYTFSAMPRLDEPIRFGNITRSRPLYSMNAKDDQGFSFGEVHGIYEQHKSEAPGWHFESVESGGHRFIYGTGGSKHVQALLENLLHS